MAVEFDGVDQYINTGNWNPPVVENLTIMAWVRPAAPLPLDGRIVYRNAGATAEFGLVCDDVTASPTTYNARFDLDTTIGGLTALKGATAIDSNEWHHIAGVYAGSPVSQMRVYVDAVQDASAAKVGFLRQNNIETWIGARPLIVTERPYSGRVEDVRIYTRSLGVQELQTIIATLGGDGIVDGLLARWPLVDFGPGIIAGSATDISGSGFSGVGVNDPTYEDGIIRGPRMKRNTMIGRQL